MRKRREVTIPRMRFLRFEVEGGMNLANKLRTDFLLKQMNSLVENSIPVNTGALPHPQNHARIPAQYQNI